MAEEKDEPGTDWGRLTAWMNRKNPNWKRVEANMRAMAVKEARSARLHRLHEEELRKMQCYEALCKEAAEWSPIITKDPTAIHRMPDTFESAPFPSNKHLFQLAARRQSPVPRWPAPCPFPLPLLQHQRAALLSLQEVAAVAVSAVVGTHSGAAAASATALGEAFGGGNSRT